MFYFLPWGLNGRMVWKGEGSSRGVPRHRSGDGGRGRGRHHFRGEKFAVPSGKVESVHNPVNKGKGVQAVDRNARQSGDQEHAECAGSFREMQLSSTSESINDQTDDFIVGLENSSGSDGLGFRVGEKVEEVGVKSLLEKATRIDLSHLSQSELESNRQQQEDELLVLQSIYGTDYVSIDEGGGAPAAFMINLHLEIGDGIKVAAEAPCNAVLGSPSVVDDDNSFTVQVLPPISLLCVFPPTYPSHSAPLFELTCVWLSSKKLSSLCTSLDSIWEATSPEVVVYTWSEWLRSQALHHVGASEKLQLEPDENSNAEGLDDRAVSGSESFDVDIFRLLRYNEEVKSKKFLDSLHTCCICYAEFPGFGFTRLPCQHYFCKSCMQQYCNMHVKEGTVMNLTCPDVSCKESVPPALLRELLDKEAFERWEELLLQKTLDSMPDVVYCPKCRTPSIEDPDHLVQCSKCRFSFCSLCMSNWHPGQNCMTPEAKLRILQARRQGRAMGEERLKQEKELINECLDLDYIKKEAKQCPTCKIAVQKSEGCNKMTCGNCGGYFCFQCGQSIRGYDHFRNSASCVLLDQIEINRWELQFNLQQLQEQELVPRNPRGAEGMAAARPCPNCKQVNYKDGGNNHIFCFACQNHYCGVCNKMVRRSAGHFGVNKCKQHTAD